MAEPCALVHFGASDDITQRHNQPFVNPARRSPVTTYGHARISLQSSPDR